jgi:hypothetical protein
VHRSRRHRFRCSSCGSDARPSPSPFSRRHRHRSPRCSSPFFLHPHQPRPNHVTLTTTLPNLNNTTTITPPFLFFSLSSRFHLPLSVNFLLPVLACPPLLLFSTTGLSFPTPLPSGCGRGVGKLGPAPNLDHDSPPGWGKDRRFGDLGQLRVPTRVPNRVPSRVPIRHGTLFGTQGQGA